MAFPTQTRLGLATFWSLSLDALHKSSQERKYMRESRQQVRTALQRTKQSTTSTGRFGLSCNGMVELPKSTRFGGNYLSLLGLGCKLLSKCLEASKTCRKQLVALRRREVESRGLGILMKRTMLKDLAQHARLNLKTKQDDRQAYLRKRQLCNGVPILKQIEAATDKEPSQRVRQCP